jgi:hypothetical protein
MPYKDPERKRQWEREHREERNAMRRTRSLPVVPGRPRETAMPDLITEQKADTGSNVIAAFAVGASLDGSLSVATATQKFGTFWNTQP